MLRSVLLGLTAAVMAYVMPAVLIAKPEIQQNEPLLLVVEQPANGSCSEDVIMVELKTGDGICSIPIDTYLTGVVLSEMPVSFSAEALKAQAVAARTFTLRQMNGGKHTDYDLCSDSTCCQAWTSAEQLKDKLGESWESCWNKISSIVSSTNGEILTYHGSLIDAVYFSCSGGRTEDAVAVWGSEVPYLQSVDSPGEEYAPSFRSEVMVSTTEFKRKISAAYPQAELNGKEANWIGEVTRTEGGGIEQVEIGGCQISGTSLRSMFGLRSTDFTISADKDTIRFSVTGYGHRVGMSQYGADAMAREGKDYREILLHYYSGVTIEQLHKE